MLCLRLSDQPFFRIFRRFSHSLQLVVSFFYDSSCRSFRVFRRSSQHTLLIQPDRYFTVSTTHSASIVEKPSLYVFSHSPVFPVYTATIIEQSYLYLFSHSIVSTVYSTITLFHQPFHRTFRSYRRFRCVSKPSPNQSIHRIYRNSRHLPQRFLISQSAIPSYLP